MKKNGPRELREELAPTIRIRSSSATESSKPNNNVRRNNSTIPKPYNFTQGNISWLISCLSKTDVILKSHKVEGLIKV